MRVLARACFAVAILILPILNAQAQQTSEHWEFALTPYLWLPNVNGTLKYSVPPGASGSPDVGVGPNSWLQNLSGALMLAGEARNGRWSVVSDLIYLDFRSEKSNVKDVDFGGPRTSASLDLGTKSSLNGVQWLLASGYTAVQTPDVTLDVLGGFRYLGLKASTDWQLSAAVSGPGGGQTFPASGGISERTDLWDAIVGMRGRVRLRESQWFVPYYLDVGAGSSSLTWQSFLGVAYAFKWGDVTLGYRYLYYDQSDDKLFQNFRFSGPSLSASFRF